MKLLVVEREDVEFPGVAGPDVDLRVGPEEVREIVRAAQEKQRDPSLPTERSAWAVVEILGRARIGEYGELDPVSQSEVADWMSANAVGAIVFWYLLHRFLPVAVPALSSAVLRARPSAVVVAYQGALMATGEIRAQCLRHLATYPLDSVREHYFALLGKHRRLLPPGAIPTKDFTPEVLTDVLRAGVTDRVAAVRERAIAAAFGMNVVGLVRSEVIARVDDESTDVRQYALVALGTLDDAASLARLHDTLERGTQEETTSAIWALARRPDGLDRVLAMASDPRAWVVSAVVGAVAEVSAPMTDGQLAALAGALDDPRLPGAIARHIRRAREGGPEYGADGGWFVVRSGASNV